MVTHESKIPYDRPVLSKGMVSGSMPESMLPLRDKKFYSRLKIDLKQEARVERIDTGSRELFFAEGTKGGKSVRGDAVLLASGGRAKTLPIEGFGLPGSFTLRSFADGIAVKQRLNEGDRIVLIGASFIAMELAAEFIQAGYPVSVVAPEKAPMVLVFGERVAERVKKLHGDNGVTFYLENKPERIGGKEKVEEVVLESGETIPADVVITGVGIEPELSYLEGSPFIIENGIEVNNHFETKESGFYAAGDIARVPFPQFETPVRVEHWVEAEKQGQAAALSMMGKPAEYRKPPFFWTRQYDLSLKYAGFPFEFEQIAYSGDVEGGSFLAGYYRDNRLFGVLAADDNARLIKMEDLLEKGETPDYGEFGG